VEVGATLQNQIDADEIGTSNEMSFIHPFLTLLKMKQAQPESVNIKKGTSRRSPSSRIN